MLERPAGESDTTSQRDAPGIVMASPLSPRRTPFTLKDPLSSVEAAAGRLVCCHLHFYRSFRARRIRSRACPRSAPYDAHIGNSRCAVAPRNDAAYEALEPPHQRKDASYRSGYFDDVRGCRSATFARTVICSPSRAIVSSTVSPIRRSAIRVRRNPAFRTASAANLVTT